ncbi:MAG TPA: glycogen debranching N-terminal domain-containing protein [Terracidiphilus sp.]|nr:glycogen debranching N-terminal domain-containing protein [Terracidiphilus sp.]
MVELTKPVELRQIPAPPEPRIAYPEPHLWATEITALVRGKTFLATDLSGNVVPPGHPNVGFFCDDTRFLSHLHLRVNGHPAVVLSSNTSEANATRVEMTPKGSLHGDGLDLPVNAVYMRREQVLEGSVLHDVLSLRSFHAEPIRLTIDISFGADFMDIFQVRGILRGKTGTYYAPIHDANTVVFVYEGLDQKIRTTTLVFEPAPAQIRDSSMSWKVELQPFGNANISGAIIPRVIDANGGVAVQELLHPKPEPRLSGGQLDRALAQLEDDLGAWQAECSRFRSDNDIFDAMLHTSIRDFYSLQIRQPAGRAIAAGIPWFATIFGRDSLIASFETLILNSELAKGTLRVLAAYQGQQTSDERDEDPGKILHELRSGEMTNTGEVAFGRNYGSVDATPLFVILLSEFITWSGDRDFLHELEPHLRRAIDWILNCGDLDGDGLIEYCRRSPKGLQNQGWKDSGDAMAHADGALAQPPIALVEVQGYAISAFERASTLFAMLGDHQMAAKLKASAANLRERLVKMFWLREESYFAMALDRDKNPLRVKSSNPGHLLFTQAIDEDKAHHVVDCLMDLDMNSGWGLRTLSERERTFNPMSYHRGSVWPHDNAMTVYGMARYGFHSQSSQICTSLYDSALRFRDYRLPELFCGIQRGRGDDPVHYPVSCTPQAWASGAMLLMLTGMLGICPDAERHELKIVHPNLPPFLNELSIDELRVGNSRVWLEFLRRDGRTACHLTRLEGEKISVNMVYR